MGESGPVGIPTNPSEIPEPIGTKPIEKDEDDSNGDD